MVLNGIIKEEEESKMNFDGFFGNLINLKKLNLDNVRENEKEESRKGNNSLLLKNSQIGLLSKNMAHCCRLVS